MIKILQGGQTGVDRGAWRAAIDNGWAVGGWMPSNCRDELGQIPQEVTQHMMPLHMGGLSARTQANVTEAAALLIVVPDAQDPKATPGTKLTLELAAARGLPRLIADPSTPAIEVARWIRGLLRGGIQLVLDQRHDLGFRARPQLDGALLLMVAGPRESKWPGAQVETAGLLRRVELELRQHE